MFTDKEAKLFGVALNIVNNWAENFVNVVDGKITKEQAFDNYNEYLVPLGQILHFAMILPGVAEQVERVTKEANSESIF